MQMHGTSKRNEIQSYVRCSVCHETFTDDEWDDRHSDEDGLDCHERCCPYCHDGTEETSDEP